MTIAISIPVHEKQYVVIDQIKNIRKYVPNSVIIIHISAEFTDYSVLADYIYAEDRVYLNPERLSSRWGRIVDAHISNYKYIKSIEAFDYFMLHASNDMYILPGVENYITEYDAGFHIHKIYKPSRWWPGAYALEDPVLKETIEMISAESVVATQVEGSYYKNELFGVIVAIIEKAREQVAQRHIPKWSKDYTREEVYFSTIAYKLLQKNENARIGYPTTYSEVHDFDRMLWRRQYITWGIYHRLGLEQFINRAYYEQYEKNYTRRLENDNPAALTVGKVEKILSNPASFLRKHSYLNDSVTKYRLYGDKVFSVKRVPRRINDPLRRFINSL
ncbi:MAG: hypothetical protein E7306_14400 [Butyrivibrio sp.]|nr:hypothetical protein [Butyrivibrio sp.]